MNRPGPCRVIQENIATFGAPPLLGSSTSNESALQSCRTTLGYPRGLGIVCPLSNGFGLDSRFRVAMGTQNGAMAVAEPKFDLLAGPSG